MKLVALLGLAFVFGLLFHGLSHWLPLVPASFAAAAIVTVAWRWWKKSFALRDAFIAGIASVLLVLTNILIARGVDGFVEAITQRPTHYALSFLLALVSIPICALVVNPVWRFRE